MGESTRQEDTVVNGIDLARVVDADDPKYMVEKAEVLGQQLGSDEAAKTQFRRLFATLQQIEMTWPRTVDKENASQQRAAFRQLMLFKPRLAYQAKQHNSLAKLADVLQMGITRIGQDPQREKLQRLVQFTEATLAYYVASDNRYQNQRRGG